MEQYLYIWGQDTLSVLTFLIDRIAVSLAVGGDFVEMLFFGNFFLFIYHAAFPCSFWGSAYTLVFSVAFISTSWNFSISMAKMLRIYKI